MKRTRCVFHPALLVIFAAAVIAGCANTQPTQFYIMNPVLISSTAKSIQAGGEGVFLEIGPVTVPSYLERPQIVTRTGENELHVEDFHQWAELFEKNVTRVMAENLSAVLSTDRIEFYPARRSSPVDYRISVDIIQFDANQAGQVVLIARWKILNRDGESLVPLQRSRFEETIEFVSYDGIAAGMSRLLGKLSRQLAVAVSDIR